MTDLPLRLEPIVAAAMRTDLAEVSERVVAAVVAEVPSYSTAFSSSMAATIRRAVALALQGFVDRLASPLGRGREASAELVRTGAYDLGRGEARSGRSMDALLAAYRVGARVAWRGLMESGVGAGLAADDVVVFAEMVFAYIDELSAVSVAGHSDELETTGRVLRRRRERLASLLLDSAPADEIRSAAAEADWEPPATLTAVLVAPEEARGLIAALGETGPRVLGAPDELPGSPEGQVVLLVPDAVRSVLRRALGRRRAVLGPTRGWLDARTSYDRAVRAAALAGDATGAVDADEMLADLVLTADEAALADLRARVLAPLDGVRPLSRGKLEETLRWWLLCQGRRADVAERMYLHPQTVRYRVGQLRELFGDRLDDPEQVRQLLVALAAPR